MTFGYQMLRKWKAAHFRKRMAASHSRKEGSSLAEFYKTSCGACSSKVLMYYVYNDVLEWNVYKDVLWSNMCCYILLQKTSLPHTVCGGRNKIAETLQRTATHCNTLQHTATHRMWMSKETLQKSGGQILLHPNRISVRSHTFRTEMYVTHWNALKLIHFSASTAETDTFQCDALKLIHFSASHDPSIFVTWLMYMSDMTRSCMWHD